MHYITKVDSETGLKFMALKAKISQVNKASIKCAKEFNTEVICSNRWAIAGGIEGLYLINGTDDKRLRLDKKFNHDNIFVPNLKNKGGKEIKKAWSELPIVSKEELNSIVNYNERHFSSIGYNFNNKEYVAFDVEEKWKIKVPNDCEEITTTKYKEMFKVK